MKPASRKPGHGRRRDAAAGRDDEPRRVQHLLADAQRGARLEARGAREHRERLDPGDPVVGPAGDEGPLALGERAIVQRRLAGAHRELVRRADVVEQVAGRQQRLGRHAAAQDAQAAQRPVVDQRDGGAQVAGGARRGVPAAPGADHDHVESIRNRLLLPGLQPHVCGHVVRSGRFRFRRQAPALRRMNEPDRGSRPRRERRPVQTSRVRRRRRPPGRDRRRHRRPQPRLLPLVCARAARPARRPASSS